MILEARKKFDSQIFPLLKQHGAGIKAVAKARVVPAQNVIRYFRIFRHSYDSRVLSLLVKNLELYLAVKKPTSYDEF